MDTPAANPGRLILIDAHGLIFQVFHAIRDRMTSPSGLPTNALFGFARDLLYLRNQKPDYLVCAFDQEEPTFRSEVFPAYKANRSPMPEDLAAQIPLIRQALDALAIPVVSHPRYEADDIIATLARAGEQRGMSVWICSSDKDCRQLISDRVKVFNLRKRQEFGAAELLADWGIRPDQVIDFQTLVGDSVDNVPGVPGVGEKTAARLLTEYGTLDRLIASVDKLKGKQKENVQAALPYLARSKALVTLARDVPIPLDWDAWKLKPYDPERLLQFFESHGLQSLARQVRGTIAPGPRQAMLFDDELFPFGANVVGNGSTEAPAAPPVQAEPWEAKYHLVDTPAKFESFFAELSQQKRLAVDVETTGLDPLRCELVGLAFCWKKGEACYLPVRAPAGQAHLDPSSTLARLRAMLEDPAIEKINQNIKFDLLVLRAAGINVAGVAGDSMVADYLLRAGERSHNLEDLSRTYLRHEMIPITDLIGKKSRKGPQLTMAEVDTPKIAEYASEDADVAWRLCEILEPKLKTAGAEKGLPPLDGLYRDLEVPLIGVLADLEFTGIRLDVSVLARLSREMSEQLAKLEEEIHALAGRKFNIGSLVQLRQILFDELKLPRIRKTGITRAASTDQETLEKLAAMTRLPAHKLPRKILEHRQVSKLKGTYVDALPELVHPRTGRIHASFNQTVAATGRLSSSDPNLQNIPVRRELGQQIRQAFVPEPGWKLLTADYSQIELRLLAHFSGDENLCRAFAENRDIHASVAAQIYGVPAEQVDDAMRRAAKTVNFGVIYGISPVGLSDRLGLTRSEATKFIEAYFARYPRVLEYQARLLNKCRETGYVTTILGRRRHIEGIRPYSTYQHRNQPEREAINMEIQGSAADLIKLAMLNLHRRMKERKLRSRMLLQIHDELVFEMPPEEEHILPSLVLQEMTTGPEKTLGLKVSPKVDLFVGPNWLDVEPLSVQPAVSVGSVA